MESWDGRESFKNVTEWLLSISKHAKSDVKILLVADNCHLEAERQVSRDEVQKLASDFALDFIEISSANNINVKEAFEMLFDKVDRSRPGLKTKTESPPAADLIQD